MPVVGDTIFGRDGIEAMRAERGVRVWSDSVGEAVEQIGLVVTIGIMLHFAGRLLAGMAKAWH